MIKYIAKIFSKTVYFSVEGADIEGFLTKCTGMGIEIISPRKIKGYILTGKVSAENYRKLRLPAKKLGLKLKLIKKQGLYFTARKQRNRIGFLLGVLIIYFSVLTMNMFIWNIDVKGCERVEKAEIIEAAKKLGLKKGSLAKSHSVQDMEWKLVQEFSDLASVEINIQGSCANISVNEIQKEEEMKSDDDIPVNIVASRYGVIRKIDVFDGQGIVSVGDAVMKGDLLVSAVYEDRYNKLTLKHARANIIAETDYSIEAEFPLEQTVVKRGGVCCRITEIDVLGIKIRLGNPPKNTELPFEKEEKELYFFWIKLPINVITMRYFSVKENSITYNFEQAQNGAKQLLKEKEEEEMKNAEILSKTVSEKVKDGKYLMKADYICLMKIGEEQPIESDIQWENTDDIS